MTINDYIKSNILYLDGGMGTLLQERGLAPGESPELWNLTRPEDIIDIHRAYYDSGSNVVNTNTFGANILKFSPDELSSIIRAAVANAQTARASSSSKSEKYIALDIGPTGRLLKPMGDLDFEEAVEIFAHTIRVGAQLGVDLIFIETMNDSYETKAALLAAKENCELPVFVSNAYSENGKLMTGASPAAMVAMLEGMGADAIGVNCSFGPDKLAPIVREYLKYASVPVILKPNAGMPRSVGGRAVYDIAPDSFADICRELIGEGVRIAGGCCGTTPDHIRALTAGNDTPVYFERKDCTVVSSYTDAVFIDGDPVLIGERINPTGKKRLKEALRSGDLDYILGEGLKQQSAGAHILDVNVGLPEIDEPAMLERAVTELQAVIDLPLQIDTGDPVAMERSLRRYNGKALINSVNGKKESMDAVFPLQKKYGGVAVALTLDEDGIPATAQGRVDIAKRIIARAAEYGVDKKDLIFDTLAMAVSADPSAPAVTLEALRRIKNELGANTSLGVSNISFGLPNRDYVSAAFFTMALENGLTAAIMNPLSAEMMKAYHTFRVLKGYDSDCAGYIAFADDSQKEIKTSADAKGSTEVTLAEAVIKGLKDKAAQLCRAMLTDTPPMEIVQRHIIPALDAVGSEYEKGRAYLPGLLMSAEAAKRAFEEIKSAMAGSGSASPKCSFVIATVKGDIHDIGKNIVKLLLENYGYDVHDLGKDVPPQAVVDEVVRLRAPLVGLSALMTTTVPAMEETIKLLRREAPWAKIVVGGAVMTESYAVSIGADKYGRDAMDTVRYADKISAEL